MTGAVLYHEASGACYRKTNVQISRCSQDRGLNLYMRLDLPPMPPPSPRRPGQPHFGNALKCDEMIADTGGKFYTLWSDRSFRKTDVGDGTCWGWNHDDVARFFDDADAGTRCDRNW